MVRHITQLLATTSTIAKAEGIPPGYLAKIFQRLVKMRFVRAVSGRNRGYVFARPPENCCIYARWASATKKITELLGETSLVTAA